MVWCSLVTWFDAQVHQPNEGEWVWDGSQRVRYKHGEWKCYGADGGIYETRAPQFWCRLPMVPQPTKEECK